MITIAKYLVQSEVGSAIFLGGALSLECYLFFTSASASSLQFQICQCAKRYSAIAEASARRYPPPTPQIIESSITDEKRQIRIRTSGSVPKCHGSKTLPIRPNCTSRLLCTEVSLFGSERFETFSLSQRGLFKYWYFDTIFFIWVKWRKRRKSSWQSHRSDECGTKERQICHC